MRINSNSKHASFHPAGNLKKKMYLLSYNMLLVLTEHLTIMLTRCSLLLTGL